MNEGLCFTKHMGSSLKEAVPQFMFCQLPVELQGFFLNCWRILKAPHLLVHDKFITHINMKSSYQHAKPWPDLSTSGTRHISWMAVSKLYHSNKCIDSEMQSLVPSKIQQLWYLPWCWSPKFKQPLLESGSCSSAKKFNAEKKGDYPSVYDPG